MKVLKMFFVVSMTLLLVSSAAVAGDFDWIRNFNIQADADPSGFRARLATRFKIGDAHINMVLNNVENPSDAYMVLGSEKCQISQQRALLKNINLLRDTAGAPLRKVWE